MVADVRLQVYKIDDVEILYLYFLITKSKDKFPKMHARTSNLWFVVKDNFGNDAA